SFSFYVFFSHLDLHSFPTRRSSDLSSISSSNVSNVASSGISNTNTSSSKFGSKSMFVYSIVERLSAVWSTIFNKCQFSLSIHISCVRSEEHTSELQSRFDLVCRLLLVKKNKY